MGPRAGRNSSRNIRSRRSGIGRARIARKGLGLAEERCTKSNVGEGVPTSQQRPPSEVPPVRPHYDRAQGRRWSLHPLQTRSARRTLRLPRRRGRISITWLTTRTKSTNQPRKRGGARCGRRVDRENSRKSGSPQLRERHPAGEPVRSVDSFANANRVDTRGRGAVARARRNGSTRGISGARSDDGGGLGCAPRRGEGRECAIR